MVLDEFPIAIPLFVRKTPYMEKGVIVTIIVHAR
jgi:hypothetical protein